MERTALVTGGTRGIGRAVAEQLRDIGYTVCVTGRRRVEELDADTRARFDCYCADGADAEARERLLRDVLERHGRLSLLVNNAGMAPRVRADLLDMGEDSLREVLEANLIGPFLLTQAVGRHMAEKGGGCIVNISSVSADTVSLNRGEYCLSKAGVSMMTQLFAARLAPHGVGVYEVRPGIILTDMTAGVQQKYEALIADGLAPIARMGTPEDVARAVCLLASGALSYSTGDVLYVDGGMHIRRL